MDKKTDTPDCSHPEEFFEWDNSKGIKAPTETAKPLMHTEGFVEEPEDMEPVLSDNKKTTAANFGTKQPNPRAGQ